METHDSPTGTFGEVKLAALAGARGISLDDHELAEVASWYQEFERRLLSLRAIDMGDVWQREPELITAPTQPI